MDIDQKHVGTAVPANAPETKTIAQKEKQKQKDKQKGWHTDTKSYLYVLQCEQGKFYVGVTEKNPEERFVEHLQNADRSATWTSKYPPIKILDSRPCTDWHDEENVTLNYMSEYGMDNVRGGSFTQILLPDYLRRYVQTRLNTIKNTCYLCNSTSHYARSCPFQQPGKTGSKKFDPHYGHYVG